MSIPTQAALGGLMLWKGLEGRGAKEKTKEVVDKTTEAGKRIGTRQDPTSPWNKI
jgi:hypothetical protein